METGAAYAWDVTAREYHADTSAVSHSALEKFRQSVPLYHGLYVTKTLQPDEPTPAMALGTAVHALLLEPERFDSICAVAPTVNGRTNEGKAIKAEFEARSVGRTIITAEQLMQARLMADAARRNKLAAKLLDAPGRKEATFKLRDETGLTVKARMDLLLDCGVTVDIKTAIDPSPAAFARAAVNFAYARQQAFYCRVRQAAMGIDRDAAEFLFIVVGSTAPHECAVYQLDYDAAELGWTQTIADLERLSDVTATGKWDSPFNEQSEPIRLSFPGYAFKQENATV